VSELGTVGSMLCLGDRLFAATRFQDTASESLQALLSTTERYFEYSKVAVEGIDSFTIEVLCCCSRLINCISLFPHASAGLDFRVYMKISIFVARMADSRSLSCCVPISAVQERALL